MQLLEIGLDHARADVAVRERLAVSSADLPSVLAELQALAADAVVLSTCNRVELYLLVEEAGTVSVVTRRLFDDALGVAGRVRSGTDLGKHAVSVSAAAVRLGERTLGGLQGKVGLVIGAGSVGRAAARVLLACGVSRLLI